MGRYGSAGTVKGDPRWIVARFESQCVRCTRTIKAGERAFYWPKGRETECDHCGEAASRRFEAECQDEMMGGGWG